MKTSETERGGASLATVPRRGINEGLSHVSPEAEELYRIISASVRDMLDAYRIQASTGSVTDKALEEIIFRACSRASRRIRGSNGWECCPALCGCC
jgi:hypothetical protein